MTLFYPAVSILQKLPVRLLDPCNCSGILFFCLRNTVVQCLIQFLQSLLDLLFQLWICIPLCPGPKRFCIYFSKHFLLLLFPGSKDRIIGKGKSLISFFDFSFRQIGTQCIFLYHLGNVFRIWLSCLEAVFLPIFI